MTGHHKFNELIKDFSPERQARVEEKTAQLKQKIALTELQQAFLENQTDIYVNHLREVIAVMGGELIIKARFPDREVVINSFRELLENENQRGL
jgi:hypothetical protein